MHVTRLVSLTALSLFTSLTPNTAAQAPALTTGVRVQMAQTKHASAFPEADAPDAWIVTISADGQLYFGAKPVTPDQLFEQLRSTPRHLNAKLYVKADARSTFAAVSAALSPARSAKFDQVVLLTAQPATRVRGIVPPQGIEVRITPRNVDGRIAVHLASNEHAPPLTVNEKTVAWSDLETTLKNSVHSPDQLVEIEASDAVSFADIVRVLDAARKTGAAVALPMFHSI
jgi:biopolymer transport protein ExbD